MSDPEKQPPGRPGRDDTALVVIGAALGAGLGVLFGGVPDIVIGTGLGVAAGVTAGWWRDWKSRHADDDED